MRRRDREVTNMNDILSIVDKCEIMRIALSADNKPYIVPMNFAYEIINEKMNIYFHCALEGKKLDIIAKNKNVCFEADCSYKTTSGDTACSWSAEFESVIGEGEISILSDIHKKIHGLNLLMKHYGYEGKPEYNQRALEKVHVLCISVSSITGKRKLA